MSKEQDQNQNTANIFSGYDVPSPIGVQRDSAYKSSVGTTSLLNTKQIKETRK